ncbi:MAG: UDP-N-acetylmuramoyl-L-alanine--D-glutamate ligase [Vicinamibacterales bacterium]
MTDGFDVAGRRVVVVGAARSGVAAAELLARKGARVTLSESRPAIAEASWLRHAGVELETGGHQAATFDAADLVVLSPGVPPDQPFLAAAAARGVEVIGELELASRWLRGPIIAITGTKGKSTTTTLIGRMLTAAGRDVQVGGNIGVPLSSQVESSSPGTVHVVETSSFQLETTVRFRPWIAVWLNLADDHLDRHPSRDAYADAKARIFRNQTAADWAVVNALDPEVVKRSDGIAARRVSFAATAAPILGEAQFSVDGDAIVRRTDTGAQALLPLAAVELPGRHMRHNVLAAVAAATLAGAGPEALARGLAGFRGLDHVMEPVGQVGGVRFVNDSKATNVEAAARSIEAFDHVVALIGGRFKGGDLGELREPLRAHARAVVAIGESAAQVREAVGGVVPVETAASMADAVRAAYRLARPDGVVLLAPACASFDWFSDYAERGRAFKQEVAKLRIVS